MSAGVGGVHQITDHRLDTVDSGQNSKWSAKAKLIGKVALVAILLVAAAFIILEMPLAIFLPVILVLTAGGVGGALIVNIKELARTRLLGKTATIGLKPSSTGVILPVPPLTETSTTGKVEDLQPIVEAVKPKKTAEIEENAAEIKEKSSVEAPEIAIVSSAQEESRNKVKESYGNHWDFMWSIIMPKRSPGDTPESIDMAHTLPTFLNQLEKAAKHDPMLFKRVAKGELGIEDFRAENPDHQKLLIKGLLTNLQRSHREYQIFNEATKQWQEKDAPRPQFAMGLLLTIWYSWLPDVRPMLIPPQIEGILIRRIEANDLRDEHLRLFPQDKAFLVSQLGDKMRCCDPDAGFT